MRLLPWVVAWSAGCRRSVKYDGQLSWALARASLSSSTSSESSDSAAGSGCPWSPRRRRPRPGWRRDAHAEFHALAQPAAERIGDLDAQMPLDLVLDEAARHRQQSKPLDDGERLDEFEPGPLLGVSGRLKPSAFGWAAPLCAASASPLSSATTAAHSVAKSALGSSVNDGSPVSDTGHMQWIT